MSDTPRTEAALMIAKDLSRSVQRLEHMALFARHLERELARYQPADLPEGPPIMSDTPRTDEQERRHGGVDAHEPLKQILHFTRQLERALARYEMAEKELPEEPSCLNLTRFWIHGGATEVVLASYYDALRAQLAKVTAELAAANRDLVWFRECADAPLMKTVLRELDEARERAKNAETEFISARKDADENAPWLSIAHALCADYGIKPGHISQRLEDLAIYLASEFEAIQQERNAAFLGLTESAAAQPAIDGSSSRRASELDRSTASPAGTEEG